MRCLEDAQLLRTAPVRLRVRCLPPARRAGGSRHGGACEGLQHCNALMSPCSVCGGGLSTRHSLLPDASPFPRLLLPGAVRTAALG